MSEVVGFRYPEAADRAMARVGDIVGQDVALVLGPLFLEAPNPDQSISNFERWLMSTTSPALQLDGLLNSPAIARLLTLLLGASQPLADALVQNPELASILSDPHERMRQPAVAEVIEEGRQLLASATSYSHALDRLRYLRQRWTLGIAVNDLSAGWPEPEVWRAISDLAEALVQLAVEAAWGDFASRRELECDCPLLIVAFGKLGGQELNYSSDIDLAYVLPDGTEERMESEVARFCEGLGRALSDRMGRGFLYRVDLRLRPYGAAGPIVRSMKSSESYYRLYAQPWEIQALLKSRPIVGPSELREGWEALRQDLCFRPVVSALALEEMIAMRARIEEGADAADIKRGPGGIRDVEFPCQILQILHGYSKPSCRVRSTLEALVALEDEGVLDHAAAQSLESGYTFLRQLEHRLQLTGDLQTHTLPEEEAPRRVLARLMGEPDWPALQHHLSAHQRTIGSLYQTLIHPSNDATPRSDREAVLGGLGPLGPSIAQWFDPIEGSGAYYASLRENEDSLSRVRQIVEEAPALISAFKGSVSLTEGLLSGEIEEGTVSQRFANLALNADPRLVADTFRNAWTTVAAQWVMDPATGLPGPRLATLADDLLQYVARRVGAEFELIALGSYGARDLSFASDSDLLMLVADPASQMRAEGQAQAFLAFLSGLRRYGVQFGVDLRLRPDGGKGLLVRTYEGFAAYELEAMEMWERFALSAARLVIGSHESLTRVLKAAYAQPLTPERLKTLLAMKRRIESERVSPQHLRRDVKLGTGSLSDLEWLVHLLEMRYPTATKPAPESSFPDRIKALGRARLITAVEVDELLDAREHLLAVRFRLALLGIPNDTIPENPDKLDRLAYSSGEADGNAFLRKHEHVTDRVRATYTESLERLRA